MYMHWSVLQEATFANQYVKRSHPPHRCKWSASHQKLHLNLTWYQRYDRLLFYYWTKRHGFCCWIEIHNLGNTFLLPNEIIFLLPDILFSPCCHIKWSLRMGGGETSFAWGISRINNSSEGWLQLLIGRILTKIKFSPWTGSVRDIFPNQDFRWRVIKKPNWRQFNFQLHFIGTN